MTSNTEKDFAEHVRANQGRLSQNLKAQFDYIVCGAGSAGSVVAARLAANPDVQVLVLEAGGSDDTVLVSNPDRWFMTLGSDLDWGFFCPIQSAAEWSGNPLFDGKGSGRRFKH